MESACKDNPNCTGLNARVKETVGDWKRRVMESAVWVIVSGSGTHWKLCVIQSAANKNHANLQYNCRCNANIKRILANHSRKATTVTLLKQHIVRNEITLSLKSTRIKTN